MSKQNRKRKKKCQQKMEVYDRIVGYYRPRQSANLGKQEEIRQRTGFKIKESLENFEDDIEENVESKEDQETNETQESVFSI